MGIYTRSHKTFRLQDFMSGDKAVVANEPIKLGEYTVKADEEIGLGYGFGTQESAQGRLYGKFAVAGGATEVKGELRIEVQTSQNQYMDTLWMGRTEILNTSATDRTKQIPFNDMEKDVTEDRKIVLMFVADANATIALADSLLIMSASRQQL